MEINTVTEILQENDRRNAVVNAVFDPMTGEGAILERFVLHLSDFSIPTQYLPYTMADNEFIMELKDAGSIRVYLARKSKPYSKEIAFAIEEAIIRLRNKHDFCFWAYMFTTIKNKDGGKDIQFRLNRPQRRLVTDFENMRIANKPIREVVLKARQWGGSTVTQVYMAWLQLVHEISLNSLIVAHVRDTALAVRGMFERLLKTYPTSLLHDYGDSFAENEPKFTGVGGSQNINMIPQRNCKIKVGTAEAPDSARGDDYALVHCTEVGIWKKTEGKTPEDIVRSACSGTALKPMTMIVYESTANGVGNFFDTEYHDARDGRSIFKAIFVAWFDIEGYQLPFESEGEKRIFAEKLYKNRRSKELKDRRSQSGWYLWHLFELGATLEAINWYILKRSEYSSNEMMYAEYPSEDEEAFVNSGSAVFDKTHVAEVKKTCKIPRWKGELVGNADDTKACLENMRFVEDEVGELWVWAKPEIFPDAIVHNRYLVAVDVGGRSNKADYSVICVFDRYSMIEGDKPAVVAQWYGHIDHDLLAWKAAQIAKWYDNALLVIESNTLETRDRDHIVDGDQTAFILNQIKDAYDNLYERKRSPEEIAEGAPAKYGFHTNVSTKPMVISALVRVIRENMYVERDERCADEYKCYERKQNGSFGAADGKHDDLLMTRAIGLHICFYEMERPYIEDKNASTEPEQKRAIGMASF